MATPARGFGSFLGIAIEAAYGVPEVRTNWLKVANLGIKRTIDKRRIPHLGCAGSVSTNRRAHFIASDKSGGGVEFPMAYNDSTVLMLAHALGAVNTSGGPVFTHDITAAVPGVLESLTLEQGYGTQDSEEFRGCILTGFELKVSASNIAMLSVPGIIGLTSDGLEAQSTPVFPVASYIKHDHAGQFAFNGGLWDVTDIAIKVDRKYSDRQLLGSVLTQEPTPNDFMDITFKITVEYGQTPGLNAAWLADTTSDATLVFTGPGNNSMALTMQGAHIVDIGRPIAGPGIITQTVDFVCESDGVDEGLLIRMINDNALYSANG